MSRPLVYVTVAVIGFLAGGFAVPAGFYLGLSPVETYLSTMVGGVLGTLGLVYAGAGVRDRLSARLEAKRGRALARVQRLVDRFGAKGLGIIGPIFPGVTVSVIVGLVLGIERRALAVWLCIGVAILYGAYTAGLWLLIKMT